MTERTIVIGLDGLIKPWADRLIAAGQMPSLARLIARGTYAHNAFVAVPTLTPANWTSLATGAWVGTHGIPQFRVHHAGDPLSRTTNGFSTESCKAEYLWETAGNAGRKSILLKYPGGLPARGADVVVDGCHIHECLHALEIPKIFSTEPAGVPRITPRPAAGWRSLPAGQSAPLEFAIDLHQIVDRQIVEGRALHDRYGPDRVRLWALVTGSGARYERVLITADKDGSAPLASLSAGAWSPWLPVRFAGSGRKGHVRFALLALSPDARELTLYSTNVFPTDGWTHPAALAPELTAAVGPFLPNIGGCDTEQGFARMGTRFGAAGERAVLDLCRYQAEWLSRAAAHLTAGDDWDLLFTQTHVPDNVQHMWLSRADASVTDDAAANRIYTELIDEAYRITDGFVGALAALADERTAVVVVSDHGFVPGKAELPIVDLFAEAGLLVWKEDSGEGQGADRQTVAETPTRAAEGDEPFWIERVDWTRTLAVPMSLNEVYVNLKGREPHGIVAPGAEFERVRTRVIDLLLDYREPASGERLVNLALRREECRSLGLWGDRVGDVIFTQTALAGSHGRQLPVAERGDGSLQGFLVMAGPDYRRGYLMERTAWIVDVAPTIAHTMGLPYPRDSEGAVLHQALAGCL